MEPLYQVVDESDQIIGLKPRNKIDFKKDIYRISALWLTNSKGEVLMAQRLLSKDNDPGKWGPAAAGTLEEDETYESNIYKEAEEEIGLKGVKFDTGPKVRFHVRESFCQWFFGKCDWPEEDFVPQPSEVERVSWVPLEQLETDVNTNPDKYVPSMDQILQDLSANKANLV